MYKFHKTTHIMVQVTQNHMDFGMWEHDPRYYGAKVSQNYTINHFEFDRIYFLVLQSHLKFMRILSIM